MALTLFGMSVLIFVMLRLVPGDIADILTNASGISDPKEKAKIAHDLGIDQPILVQYGKWIGGLARGDLGFAYVSEQPAIDEILPRIPISGKLAGMALFFAVLLGVPLGVISAVRQNTKLDYFLRVISLSGLSLPAFWLGLLVLMAKSDISFLWPLTALSFVFTTFSAIWFLHEHVAPARWIGVVFIVIGAAFISYSEHAKEKPAPPAVQAPVTEK